MPYTFNWGEAGTYVKFYGSITLSELREVDDTHYGSEQFANMRYQLYDFSEADLSAFSSKDARRHAAIDNVATRYKQNFKVALVGQGEELKALFDEYINHSVQSGSTWTFRTFDTYEEALEWCQ